MKVNILIFGHLADKIGNNIVINEASDSDTLINDLKNQYPILKSNSFVLAINKKTLESNTNLHDGDEIAILPPFSGG
jgi:molybdopterin synthase sulfur carrier subunit